MIGAALRMFLRVLETDCDRATLRDIINKILDGWEAEAEAAEKRMQMHAVVTEIFDED